MAPCGGRDDCLGIQGHGWEKSRQRPGEVTDQDKSLCYWGIHLGLPLPDNLPCSSPALAGSPLPDQNPQGGCPAPATLSSAPALAKYLEDGTLNFSPGSQLGQLRARPIPHERLRGRRVGSLGSPGVGDSCYWCTDRGVWNVEGRDHLQGIILHGLAQIQQLQNMAQRVRSDVGALKEDLLSAPQKCRKRGFPTTQKVIVSKQAVTSLKSLTL